MIRLIATDLDGTLLLPGGAVGTRTRAALDAARAAGVLVVPVTARQPIGLRDLAVAAGFEGWALCSNGAFSHHLATGEVGFARALAPAVQQEVAYALTAARPGVRFAAVRGHAAAEFVAQEGYPELAAYSDHKRDPATMDVRPLAEVVAEPALKLVAREPDATPAETVAALTDLALSGFSATRSGAPFIEIAHPQVDKASGLAELCATLGIGAEEVVAFGDAWNDVPMLQWAGHGVAVANAEPEVKAVADEVLGGGNADEAVAGWIETRLS